MQQQSRLGGSAGPNQDPRDCHLTTTGDLPLPPPLDAGVNIIIFVDHVMTPVGYVVLSLVVLCSLVLLCVVWCCSAVTVERG